MFQTDYDEVKPNLKEKVKKQVNDSFAEVNKLIEANELATANSKLNLLVTAIVSIDPTELKNYIDAIKLQSDLIAVTADIKSKLTLQNTSKATQEVTNANSSSNPFFQPK